MRDLIRTLMAAGITVGLSDRETFVKEVSGIIEKYQNDPEKAEQWAGGLVAYLENMRNNINVEQVFKGAIESSSLPDKDQVDELTKAIKNLTKELQDRK